MYSAEITESKTSFIPLEEPNFFRVEIEKGDRKFIIPRMYLDVFAVTPEYEQHYRNDGMVMQELIAIKAEAQLTTLPGKTGSEIAYWEEVAK